MIDKTRRDEWRAALQGRIAPITISEEYHSGKPPKITTISVDELLALLDGVEELDAVNDWLTSTHHVDAVAELLDVLAAAPEVTDGER